MLCVCEIDSRELVWTIKDHKLVSVFSQYYDNVIHNKKNAFKQFLVVWCPSKQNNEAVRSCREIKLA